MRLNAIQKQKMAERNNRIYELYLEGKTGMEISGIIEREFEAKLSRSAIHKVVKNYEPEETD